MAYLEGEKARNVAELLHVAAVEGLEGALRWRCCLTSVEDLCADDGVVHGQLCLGGDVALLEVLTVHLDERGLREVDSGADSGFIAIVVGEYSSEVLEGCRLCDFFFSQGKWLQVRLGREGEAGCDQLGVFLLIRGRADDEGEAFVAHEREVSIDAIVEFLLRSTATERIFAGQAAACDAEIGFEFHGVVFSKSASGGVVAEMTFHPAVGVERGVDGGPDSGRAFFADVQNKVVLIFQVSFHCFDGGEF